MLVLVLLLSVACCHAIPRFRPLKTSPVAGVRADLLSQCEERYRESQLDHFTWSKADAILTFKQRYFLCTNNWNRDDDGVLGPIFFYLGNEADVTLYLNNSGLMWESAASFNAALVFAEHRYYGQSIPFGKDVRKHMQYLSAEQALADYAELIMDIKAAFNASSSPVIGFGGSYGGMLATWMRMKYPHLLDGAIAGSAPIWNFEGETPPFNPISFSLGVTHDASEAGGAAPACKNNVRKGWRVLEKMGNTSQGRAAIASATSLCKGVALATSDDVIKLRNWLADAFDYMAMGNFPYPSSYILNGNGLLPAWPVQVACTQGLHHTNLTDSQLMTALAQAAGVYYNHTGDFQCFDFRAGVNPDSDQDADFWSYQYCTEMFMPFAKDGVKDMFWEEPWDPTAVAEGCKQQWGVTPRQLWAQTEWGGRRIGAASNIAFSNGLLDPWHGGGVLDDVNSELPAIIIPEGAHHLDLMFSHPLDPLSVIEARKEQRRLIAMWIKAAQRDLPQGRLTKGSKKKTDRKAAQARWKRALH